VVNLMAFWAFHGRRIMLNSLPKLTCFLFFLFPIMVLGQSGNNLVFRLVDKATGQGVSDAFVFFAGTSVGAISEENGQVEIQRKDFLELVISHLNYETKVLSPEDVLEINDQEVSIVPSAIEIEAVTVSSDGNAARRKRWLKRFEAALLGSKKDRRQVSILNPEVILFAEDKSGLRAQASEAIRVDNDALGYDLRFLLDTFLLNRQGDVLYGGQAFFEDLAAEDDQLGPVWETSRREVFANSKRHFLSQLRRNSVDPEKYKVGWTQLDDEFEFLNYLELNLDSLNWSRGLRADTLWFVGYLTVENRDIITNWGSSSYSRIAADEYATSFLKSRSGRFIISPTGFLINNHEVEELGYWAEQRLAKRLPADFIDEGQSNASDLMYAYLKTLENYRAKFPQESVYLHRDKPQYLTGEEIWFKAYLVDATTHLPLTQSSVVHVELIDPDGKIVETRSLHREKKMDGFFTLSRSGVHRLRAYTDYMANWGEEYFFECNVPVWSSDLTERKMVAAMPTAERDPDDPGRSFSVKVVPEGGQLVAGLQNTLIIKAFDKQGRPLALSGEILDERGGKMAGWATNHEGYGICKLSPHVSGDYFLETRNNIENLRIPLPEVVDPGYLLRVNNLQEDLIIQVAAKEGVSLEGAFLIGQVRGEVFCRFNRLPPNRDISIPRRQIPAGIARFTLFNPVGEILSDRLVFTGEKMLGHELRVDFPYAFFRPRQKVEFSLSWADSLLDVGANLSVSVTDESTVYHPEGLGNIQSYLLLNGSIPERISNLNGVLSYAEKKDQFMLDLQLSGIDHTLVDWSDFLSVETKPLLRSPQKGGTLSGYVTRDNKRQDRVKAEVFLTAIHPQPFFRKLLTDEAGNFTFADLPYLDSVEYVLQAAEFVPGKSNEELLGISSPKRRVSIHLNERKPEPMNQSFLWQKEYTLPPEIMGRMTAVGNQRRLLDSLQPPGWKIDLAEVTVRGQREVDSRNLEVFNLNRLDWVNPQQPAFDLLFTLKPGSRFIRDVTKDFLLAEVNNGQGFIDRVRVSIFIDGLPGTLQRFQSLRADMIDYIVINRTSIIVVTRDQPRSARSQATEGVKYHKHPGFFAAPPFPKRDYSAPGQGAGTPDPRTTIHWDPNVRIEADRGARLSFFAADRPTVYRVRVEGVTDAGEAVFQEFTLDIRE
jgi:hypothetical protein